MNHKSLFVSFEGSDGSGKSTVAKLVYEKLLAKGYKVYLTREPGGSPLAEKIRDVIINNGMSVTTELLLFYAARQDHWEKTILPKLLDECIVITDRHIDSTTVYQGYICGKYEEMTAISRYVYTGARPDKTFIIDVDLNTIETRLANREKSDRFDKLGQSFHSKVKNNFLYLAHQNENIYEIIDNNGPLQEAVDKAADSIMKAVCVEKTKDTDIQNPSAL